ncbi:MAG: DUF481 domain-containing protein [Maribacter sp.]|nr:DUF481 domain-containing protein [Maribacter sp.]
MELQIPFRLGQTLHVLLFFFVSTALCAQNDSIKLKNNDLLVGEIKTLNKSVLVFKTSDSDKDFNIDFDDVISISTTGLCVIHLTNRTQITGRMKPLAPHKARIIDKNGVVSEISIQDIIRLEEIDEEFWSRFTGAFDVGFNLSKTNNNRQLTYTGNLKYSSDKWSSAFDFNVLYSERDNAERIERKTMSLAIQRYLKQWYISGEISYLQSTEQGIRNRITPAAGAGRLLIVSNKLFWIVGTGLTYNIEDFFDSQLNKRSTELQLITQFDMFNFENLNFTTKVIGFPSLSERGRFRVDYNFVLKYDLPFDFYIKAEFTLNYDNQPAVEGNFADYVFSSGFGWELK